MGASVSVRLREVSGPEGVLSRRCHLQTPIRLDARGCSMRCAPGSRVGEAELVPFLEAPWTRSKERRGAWGTRHLTSREGEVVREVFWRKRPFSWLLAR